MRRYNLVVADDLWEMLDSIAAKESENVVTIIRKFLKLGVLLYQNQDKALILRDKEGNEANIVIL